MCPPAPRLAPKGRARTWGTGLLVVVGFLQVWLLSLTWKTIRRQTDIQEANITQWVDIQPDGIMIETTSATSPPERISISLRWRLINNTSLPLTLEKIGISVARTVNWEEYEMVEESVVSPAGGAKGSRNFYPFFVKLDLTKKQTKDFLDKGLSISVGIMISYVEASGKRKDQYFGDIYDCRGQNMEIVEPLGKSPTHVYTEKGGKSTIRQVKSSILEVADEEGEDSAPRTS